MEKQSNYDMAPDLVELMVSWNTNRNRERYYTKPGVIAKIKVNYKGYINVQD